MSSRDYFQLRRLIDGLVYEFDRMRNADGSVGYKRRDKNLWIIFRPALGWVALDEFNESVTGNSRDVPPQNQSDYPPEGIWISRKESKSYLYELSYCEPSNG